MNLADLRAELDHLQREHPKGIHGTPDEVLVYACRLYEIMVERTATAPRQCQTCRWWEKADGENGFGPCHRWEAQWAIKRPLPPDAIAQPGHGPLARVVTGPLFACSHWEG